MGSGAVCGMGVVLFFLWGFLWFPISLYSAPGFSLTGSTCQGDLFSHIFVDAVDAFLAPKTINSIPGLHAY
ncbi:hypothetical protein AUJ68_04175 [Candidatus Woesearchaeota archaeon CG1_02_57_44]|nr:MAG: hypothetical protein AUJ68_04175 [Candidatus Woesearchaeota archaeon CG1_02_57_44]